MKIGVLLLNFGEPEEPTLEAVVPFLERIFSINAPLMGVPNPSESEVRARSRALAEARAPGLIHEYIEIGGSPLHRQSREQAAELQSVLASRGIGSTVLLGMQFTDPSIADAVAAARSQGVDHLISIPIYPLCGPSTTVAALLEVDRQLVQQQWVVPARQISGWHRHPAYVQVRADGIRDTLSKNGLSLSDPETALIFSAHGTPLKYIEEGSRYDDYVRDICAALVSELGAVSHAIGYQNHTNRPGVRWTQPDIDKVIEEATAKRIVVEAVSFMHEQSETLAELDDDLRSKAEARGIEFFRVPIPYLDSRFVTFLADLVETGLTSLGHAATPIAKVELYPCRCKSTRGTYCTNGGS